MVELFEQDIRTNERQSSKGNQLKWYNSDKWYKADYAGYEGLAETIATKVLELSSLSEQEFVVYNTEQLGYKYQTYLGCRSSNFLPEGWQMITLERLFQNQYGESLSKSIYFIEDKAERLKFVVEQVERLTGICDFGIYMSKLMTIDALLLNEDRHTHNIAVLLDAGGKYHLCPVFDNGGSLLSDTTMDYPLHVPVEILMKNAKAKTFCPDFEEQLDIAEQLYGQHIKFFYTRQNIEDIIKQEPFYDNQIKKRILDILMVQKRKYAYLFE